MKKVLILNLKKKWFDMIRAGEKTEEYREITGYWAGRFLYAPEIEWGAWQEMLEDMRNPYMRHNGPEELMAFFGVEYGGYETIRFRNGYRKDAPTFEVETEGFAIAKGYPPWGAEPGRFYFVFSLGGINARI